MTVSPKHTGSSRACISGLHFLLFYNRRNLAGISLCLSCTLSCFFSVKSVCCLTLCAGPWGWGTGLLPFGCNNYLRRLKQTEASKREPAGDDMTVNVSSPKAFCPESRKLYCCKGFWHFQGTQSQGYLSVMGSIARSEPTRERKGVLRLSLGRLPVPWR